MAKNKYYQILEKILESGSTQTNKKGGITFLTDEHHVFTTEQLLEIFEQHPIAKKKLSEELQLFMNGVEDVEAYNKVGVQWWNYCAPKLFNSYPKYFAKLPGLIAKINAEKRPSKNYVLYLGETGVETPQLPCVSLIQFQIINDELIMQCYIRSSDANLGLPSDLFHLYLIAAMIDVPLKSVAVTFANVHIYDNNVEKTKQLLAGEKVSFSLNV